MGKLGGLAHLNRLQPFGFDLDERDIPNFVGGDHLRGSILFCPHSNMEVFYKLKLAGLGQNKAVLRYDGSI